MPGNQSAQLRLQCCLMTPSPATGSPVLLDFGAMSRVWGNSEEFGMPVEQDIEGGGGRPVSISKEYKNNKNTSERKKCTKIVRITILSMYKGALKEQGSNTQKNIEGY